MLVSEALVTVAHCSHLVFDCGPDLTCARGGASYNCVVAVDSLRRRRVPRTLAQAPGPPARSLWDARSALYVRPMRGPPRPHHVANVTCNKNGHCSWITKIEQIIFD